MGTISVLMATYNGAKFIEEQIESIQNQVLRPDKIVISDDGSFDNTVAIIERISRSSPVEIILRRQPQRLGYAGNFLSLMRDCHDDFVFLSDQDDIWLPSKISTVVNAFTATGKLLLTHDLTITTSDTSQVLIPSYFSALDSSSIPRSFNRKGCALAYRKELVDLIGWPLPGDEKSHDGWLCLIAAVLGLQGFVQESLILHRIHGGNTSGIIFTERSRLKKMIRALDDAIWPISDLDRLVAHVLDPAGLDGLESQLNRLTNVDTNRVHLAIAALHRKRRVVNLQRSNEYNDAGKRALISISLFLKGDYLSAGNISGLLADLMGARPVSLPSP